jgi:CBS domain-containing protein
MRAMDVMTANVITADENASVQTVAKLMAEHGISAVPVVDQDNRVIAWSARGISCIAPRPEPSGGAHGGLK